MQDGVGRRGEERKRLQERKQIVGEDEDTGNVVRIRKTESGKKEKKARGKQEVQIKMERVRGGRD